ncbi:hypothetical protein TruAng_011460 [Truncatella angustata]|nr:hypothetical protein TruAng_011460 [Truncatella angustata]
MSEEVGVPIHKITLTLTVYMVVQGVSPSFWGPLSDVKGRRLVFCCTLVLYLIANICLAVTRDYGSLAAFRALQAAGGAATIAICSGVIGDIASPAERGGMIGMSSAIRQAAQFLGPVAGGIITHYHGVRAIFCFLAMITSVVLVMVVVFLPETLPPIAGNGDVRLHSIHKPIMYAFKAQPDVFKEHSQMPSKPFTLSSLWTPICLLTQLDVFIVMFYGGIIYTIHNMVTASSTGLLQPRFKLTDVQTGLIFLPNGIGVIVGSFVWGNVLDRNWKTYDSKDESNDQELLEEKSGNGRFKPVHMERARLRHSWWLLLGFVASVCGYGFVLKAAHLAVVLVMQFCIAFTAQAVFAMCSTMSIDLFPQAAASVTALQNLVRCTLGAAGVAVENSKPIIYTQHGRPEEDFKSEYMNQLD